MLFITGSVYFFYLIGWKFSSAFPTKAVLSPGSAAEIYPPRDSSYMYAIFIGTEVAGMI